MSQNVFKLGFITERGDFFFIIQRFVTDYRNAFCIWVLILEKICDCSEEDLPSKLQLFNILNNQKYLLTYCFSPEVM